MIEEIASPYTEAASGAAELQLHWRTPAQPGGFDQVQPNL